jgi:hypothetical protein
MGKITNTTDEMRDPASQAALLAEGMVTGDAGTFIERAGQHELVHSDSLPSDCRDKAAFEALGFTFGDPDPSDPLFMPATLPEGWEKRATDHSMGSVITDHLGRERVSVFYKAAFYDRSAHMSLIGLHWYVQKSVEYDGPAVIFDDEWATRDAVLAELKDARQEHLNRAAEFRGYAEETERRDEDNRVDCARIAAENEAKGALYDPYITELSAG